MDSAGGHPSRAEGPHGRNPLIVPKAVSAVAIATQWIRRSTATRSESFPSRPNSPWMPMASPRSTVPAEARRRSVVQGVEGRGDPAASRNEAAGSVLLRDGHDGALAEEPAEDRPWQETEGWRPPASRRWFGSAPVLPVLRPTSEISNCDDVKVVRLDPVDDPKRKPVNQTTTSVPG